MKPAKNGAIAFFGSPVYQFVLAIVSLATGLVILLFNDHRSLLVTAAALIIALAGVVGVYRFGLSPNAHAPST